MSELLQFIIVIAFGGLCFGCGYLVAFIVTRTLVRTLALKFRIGFIRSRAALDVGLASVSPELDHFFLAKRRAGDPWPSGDRAIELAGRWHQHPA
jgi:hypothetical protein